MCQPSKTFLTVFFSFFSCIMRSKEVKVGTKFLPTKRVRGEGGREEEKEEEVAGKEKETDERSWEEIDEDNERRSRVKTEGETGRGEVVERGKWVLSKQVS